MLCLQGGRLQNTLKAKIITENNKKSAQKFGWNRKKYYLCTIKIKQNNKTNKNLQLWQSTLVSYPRLTAFASFSEEQKALAVRNSEVIAKYATLITETSAKYYIENR